MYLAQIRQELKTAAYDKIRPILTPIFEPVELYYGRKRECSDPSHFHRT